jgi:hypothetical protein
VLIARWQQGDERSFDVLYSAYILKILEVLKLKIGFSHTARELAQYLFFAIMFKKKSLQRDMVFISSSLI